MQAGSRHVVMILASRRDLIRQRQAMGRQLVCAVAAVAAACTHCTTVQGLENELGVL
eukprot:SAG22_NODE_105_length_20045_cov_23.373308_13_plen_57_part_00